MDKENIRSLPKLDLHCHLDGSMSLQTVGGLLAEQGIILSAGRLEEELRVSDDCASLTEYLKRFKLPLLCLQTKNGLKQAAVDLMECVARENVRYLEIRFAPMLCTEGGLSVSAVIESVLEGIREAQGRVDVQAGVLVCAMRNHSLETNQAMLRCARTYLGQGVSALDLAGDESSFPAREQAELFQLAKRMDMPFTIHCGECGSAENIREAVELGARRLGHAIALRKDVRTMALCRDKGIGIEMCPTSNLQTKAVRSWEEYPLRLFMEAGLPVTVNTDNRTVSNTSVTEELMKASAELGLGWKDIVGLMETAVQISFADDSVKHRLLMEMKG